MPKQSQNEDERLAALVSNGGGSNAYFFQLILFAPSDRPPVLQHLGRLLGFPF